MTKKPQMPRVPKPRPKKKEPRVVARQFKVQLGRTRHRDYIHSFETAKQATAGAIRLVSKLEPDLRRWNSAGIAVLDEIKADIGSAEFGRRPTVICRVIDDHTGQDVYLELWRES